MRLYRPLLLFVLLISPIVFPGCSCGRHESSRAVTIERASGTVWISRHGRHVGLTAEGPFPEWTEAVRLHCSRPIPERGQFVLKIPDDTAAQYDAVSSGEVQIDLDTRKANVHLTPSSSYYWLALDGIYPVVIK